MIHSNNQKEKTNKLPIKNTLSTKVIIQNWKRNKAKAKWGVSSLSLTRNVNRTSLSRKERVLISNKITYESKNLTGKGKCIVKVVH